MPCNVFPKTSPFCYYFTLSTSIAYSCQTGRQMPTPVVHNENSEFSETAEIISVLASVTWHSAEAAEIEDMTGGYTIEIYWNRSPTYPAGRMPCW